jgi:hypothetical protein
VAPTANEPIKLSHSVTLDSCLGNGILLLNEGFANSVTIIAHITRIRPCAHLVTVTNDRGTIVACSAGAD